MLFKYTMVIKSKNLRVGVQMLKFCSFYCAKYHLTCTRDESRKANKFFRFNVNFVIHKKMTHACMSPNNVYVLYNKSLSAQNDHISNHQNYRKQCHGSRK